MISTTVSQEEQALSSTAIFDEHGAELLTQYESLLTNESIRWAAEYKKIRMLGKGGQGVVYLSERQGTDLFCLPVAIKIFSPESYRDVPSYVADMVRIADISSRVALIQHDNLLDLHNFIEHGGVRIMIMEWIDGHDLRDLMTEEIYQQSRTRLRRALDLCQQGHHVRRPGSAKTQARRRHPDPARVPGRPGCPAPRRHRPRRSQAVQHHGQAYGQRQDHRHRLRHGPRPGLGTPHVVARYAAPEVLAGGKNTPQSDLASLGYVLIEMLAGQSPFDGLNDYRSLLAAKKGLDKRLKSLLPDEVSCNEMLLHLCQKLIAPDPAKRFPDAQAADLDRKGAADFHRQLVKGDLASEYEHDLRLWLEELN